MAKTRQKKDDIIKEQDEIIEELSEQLLKANLELYAKEQKKTRSYTYGFIPKRQFTFVSSI